MEGYEYKELASLLRDVDAHGRVIVEHVSGERYEIESIFSVGAATDDPGIVIRVRETPAPYHGMATTAQAGSVQRNEGN